MVYIVGDSVEADCKGALDAGLKAILYAPMMQESQESLFGEEITAIHHMDQLLEHLGMPKHSFDLAA